MGKKEKMRRRRSKGEERGARGEAYTSLCLYPGQGDVRNKVKPLFSVGTSDHPREHSIVAETSVEVIVEPSYNMDRIRHRRLCCD